jgi:hypothetical protein
LKRKSKYGHLHLSWEKPHGVFSMMFHGWDEKWQKMPFLPAKKWE